MEFLHPLKRSKMIKSKKKVLPILLSVLVLSVLCLACFSFKGVNAYADPDKPKQVSLVEFQLFNAYSEDSRREDAVESKYGMLLRFDDVLSDNLSEVNGGIKTVNLIDLYGKNIFINDMPLDFYTNAEVCYYLEGYMWVYIPNFVFSAYRTFSVKEPFVFKDRTITPFVLYSSINEYGFVVWGTEYTQTTQDVAFRSIMWNNKGYRYFDPKNGLLLEFDKNLSNVRSEFEGAWMRTNLVDHDATQNKFLGEGKSVGENILLDGVPFKDIQGAEIIYHSERFLWLYAPDMTSYATLEIKDHTLFLDSFLPGKVLYSNGDTWMESDPNASRKYTMGTESVSYKGIEWNNADFNHRGGKNGVLIKFSANLSKDKVEIDGGVQNVNKVKTGIGEHIKLNSVPLKNIDGAEICYHNEGFLWVYIPSDDLSLSDDDYPRLTIDANTEFLNAVLPEVTLYFDGSYWQENAPEEYDSNSFVEIMHNNVSVEGNAGYAYTVLTFEDDFLPAAASRPNFAQTGDAGQKIRINGVTLNELYNDDNDTRCSFGEAYDLNAVYLLLNKSDLFPQEDYPVTTLTIEEGTRLMDKTIGAITLYLVDGKWSKTNSPSAPLGEDTDAPYLYYDGEDEYLVIADKDGAIDDFLSDLSKLVYAFDERDGMVRVGIGLPKASTSGDKWNRGEWLIKIVATDSNNNTIEKDIIVKAINSEEQYLSVYVNGIFSYTVRYGDKIDKGKDEVLAAGDPQKVDSASSYFVFSGWAFKGELWDFDNDVATEDVWLSPTFKEYPRLFTLTVKDTKTGKTAVSTVKYGETIDFAEYAKDDSAYAIVDDTVVKKVTVNNDIYAELKYNEIGGGTNGTIAILIGCWAVSAFLIALGVILYKKLGKKAGK